MDRETIVFIHLNNTRGGTEYLLVRKIQWLITNNYRVVVITTEGTMQKEYEKNGAEIILVPESSIYYKEIVGLDLFNILAGVSKKLIGFNIKVIEVLSPEATMYGICLSSIVGSKLLVGVVHPYAYDATCEAILHELNLGKCLHSVNQQCIDSHNKILNKNLENVKILPVPITLPDKHVPVDFSKVTPMKILTIARLEIDKIYIFGLIKAFKEIRAKHSNIKLVIIGDGPLKNKMENYAKKIKVYDYCEFLGSKRHEELAEFYKDCYIYVGMGTTALEAGSYLKPVIVSYVRMQENISPGFLNDLPQFSFGEIIENWDNFSFTDKINEIIDNDVKYKEIAKACHNVSNQCHIDNIMREWLCYIEEQKTTTHMAEYILTQQFRKRNFIKSIFRNCSPFLVDFYKKVKEKIK